MGTAAPDSPIIDLTEVLDLVRGLEARGAKYIIESAGNPSLTLALTQPDKKIPDYAYLHFWFQKELRQALKPETGVIGSAYSIFRDGKNRFRGVKRGGVLLRLLGRQEHQRRGLQHGRIGRQSLADPCLPAKLEAGKESEIEWCTCCDNCIEFLIRQKPVGCATHEKEYTQELKGSALERGAS